MKKSTRNVLVGSAFAAGLLHSAYQCMTRYLVKVALDRKLPIHSPGAREKLSGGGIDPAVEERLQTCAKRLEATPHETVMISAEDGIGLVGHWFAKEGARRVILAMHGWRSGWSHDFGAVADFWFAQGCSVLLPEQRGQGKSGGEYMGFGLLERYDCLSWIRWLNEHGCSQLPIYLCGVSMGASTVLMAAGLTLPANVKGVVADCGYTSAGAVWKHVAGKNLGISFNLCRFGANALCKKRLHMGMDDYSCTQAMSQCKVPVLFIHGDADAFVPVEMTYENYAACASPKELLIVPGAAHGMSYFTDAEAYRRAITALWERQEQ